jgi:hypothetical protein
LSLFSLEYHHRRPSLHGRFQSLVNDQAAFRSQILLWKWTPRADDPSGIRA